MEEAKAAMDGEGHDGARPLRGTRDETALAEALAKEARGHCRYDGQGGCCQVPGWRRRRQPGARRELLRVSGGCGAVCVHACYLVLSAR